MGARRLIALVLCFPFAFAALGAEEEATAPPTPEQLAAMERVRPMVEGVWREIRSPSDPDPAHPRGFLQISDTLISIGPDVIPFLTSELDLAGPTFHFCAYALGRLGGKEAEAALRKAVRRAEARGGKFGMACRRWALYGLALLGAPDVMDMIQDGDKTMFGIEVIPDLPLVAHAAILIGSPGAPVLEKQLTTERDDPKANEKLENTILALGYAGDASTVPKLIPFLTSASPQLRVQAADSISRLAEPAVCEKLLPLLSAPEMQEREYIAATLERWKPEPCYKAMVGHLEVESDLGVRAALFRAIAAMKGEASLDVFRAYLGGYNDLDAAVVIKAIGDVGSKKGLNMLRAVLPSKEHLTVVRALEAIAEIGGEGAMDTLFAVTADRRPGIGASARDILWRKGVKKVAPRVAEDLLSTVREPVGNRRLLVPISGSAEALVALSYTDPADDLKKAAAVQTLPEIAQTLDSCARRLQLLAKNGDDVAAWAAEAASTDVPVRRLAERRLAEIGSAAAIRALTARLAKPETSPEERTDILMAIANARTEGAAEVVERHLADPTYDAPEFQDARAAAAWAARRIGGERMARALRESAVRREGQDWGTVVYLGLVDKAASIPTLKTVRVQRLRYPESRYGRQETLLEILILELSAGRPVRRFDVPPESLFDL